MLAKRVDNLNGSLDLLILETLDYSPQHGTGIVAHIHTASEGILQIEDGSLYPALHRLEREKFIKGQWHTTESSRRARLYAITAAGRSHLDEIRRHWKSVAKGVKLVLRFQRV